MIVTTTDAVEGRRITDDRGVVVGEAIMGANAVRDFLGGIGDTPGGRSGAYETMLRDAREVAFLDLEAQARQQGANAVAGVDLDDEVVGESGSMLMVSGTAVVIEPA